MISKVIYTNFRNVENLIPEGPKHQIFTICIGGNS